MAEAVNNAEKNKHRSQAFIRIASYVFVVAALLCFALAMLFHAAAGDPEALAEAGGAEALEACNILMAISAAEGVFYLVLGILGLRCAHDASKAMPFAVLSVILAAVTVFEQMTTNYSAVTNAVTSGGFDMLYLVLVVFSVGSAFAAFSLVNYNKRHPAGETSTPAPEYVPESMRQTGVAPFSSARVSTGKGGQPLELRLSSKIGSVLHDKIDILDSHDNVIYRVSSKAVSISDRTFIEDAAGNQVASIHAKVVSIHSIYYVEMADGTQFELSRELMHLKDVVNIDALGWQLSGDNMLEFSFHIVDAQGAVVAEASRALVSMHDTYTVTIYDRSVTDEVVAVFVIMKHIMEHRAAEASSDAARASSTSAQ